MVGRARFLAFAHDLLRSRFYNQKCHVRSGSVFCEISRKNFETTLAMDRVGRTMRFRVERVYPPLLKLVCFSDLRTGEGESYLVILSNLRINGRKHGS